MLKLSKRVEYALLAVQEMALRPMEKISATEIAERHSISQSLVAKVLQQLGREGVTRSYAGVTGGYMLDKPTHTITIAEIIRIIEGSPTAIVDCQHAEHHDCAAHSTCTIREPLTILQERIQATFASMTVAELASPRTFVQLEVS
jgi:Rrf2 family protein